MLLVSVLTLAGQTAGRVQIQFQSDHRATEAHGVAPQSEPAKGNKQTPRRHQQQPLLDSHPVERSCHCLQEERPGCAEGLSR